MVSTKAALGARTAFQETPRAAFGDGVRHPGGGDGVHEAALPRRRPAVVPA